MVSQALTAWHDNTGPQLAPQLRAEVRKKGEEYPVIQDRQQVRGSLMVLKISGGKGGTWKRKLENGIGIW